MLFISKLAEPTSLLIRSIATYGSETKGGRMAKGARRGWHSAQARCVSARAFRCIAETIGPRSGPVISGARNRSSRPATKNQAENEIRITVVGRDRIMADNDDLGRCLGYHPPVRPLDHIFSPFLFPPFPRHACPFMRFIAYRDFHTKLRPTLES